MEEERNVLSREEVEAIITSTDNTATAQAINGEEVASESKINTHAIANISETLREILESKLTALFRKKIVMKTSPATALSLEELVKDDSEANVYSIFKIKSHNTTVLVVMTNDFLDIAMNLLFGGKLQESGEGSVQLGKVGVIASEKLALIVLESFVSAVSEYEKIVVEHYKTSHLLHTIMTLPNDKIHCHELTVCFNEIEKKFKLYLPEEFLAAIAPVNIGAGKHREKDFWRTSIKEEVVDSYVTVTTNMSDVKINVNKLLELKEGDEIEIIDPTVVYVCLNDLKIYRALAGQSNSKVVVKIVGQI